MVELPPVSDARISVAMCTCNGGRFVREQLESIAAQYRLPNELVVCDDCSTDGTAEQVRQFAAHAPFPVRWEVNAQRLGSSTNFAQAISRCQGDWILLADQDDIWLPQKISRILQAAAARPEVALWFSDALMVNLDRQLLGYHLWDAISLTPRERVRIDQGQLFHVLMRHNVVSGLTVAMRARYRDMILPIPSGWVHDGWIALLLSAVAACAAIAEPLVEYRQHPDQQLGEKKRTLYQQYQRAKLRGLAGILGVADNYQAARDRLELFRERLSAPTLLDILDAKIAHLQVRTQVCTKRCRSWPLVFGQLFRGHYSRFSYGWKSVARDLFI